MSYHFTRYQPKYREEIIQLQTALWSPDLALNSAYLAWKYDQNPYLNEPLIYLALQNERVVGMRGLYGAQWEIAQTGQTVILPCTGDTIIAREHRNRGLLRQLLQFQHADRALTAFPYMLSFSAGAPVYFCLLSEGWRVIGAYGTLVRPTPIGKLLKSERLKSWARHPAINTLWRVAAHLRHTSLWRAHIQGSLELRAEDMASLVARTCRPDKIRQHKDSRYYAWRFRSPLRWYKFFYWQKTTLEGFLVLRRNSRFTAGPVQLVDWAATTPEVLTELLQAALQDVGLGSLEIWSATLPEAMVATLGELGFTPAESPASVYRPALLGRCLNAALLDRKWSLAGWDIGDLENWDLRMVYSDQY
jgi:hypothetical protein